MEQPTLVFYALITLFMLISFLINGIESAFFALNHLKLRRQAKIGKKSAHKILNITEHTEQFFWTNAIGRTICNTATVFLIILLSAHLSHSTFYNFTHLGAFLLIFYLLACLLPKILANKNPRIFCSKVAIVPYHFLFSLCYPLGTISQQLFKTNQTLSKRLFSNHQQFRKYLKNCNTKLPKDELTMVEQVMVFFEKKVYDAMVPKEKVIYFSTNTTLGDAKAIANQTGLTRFPIYDNDKQNTVGILSMKVVLYKEDAKDSDPVNKHMSTLLVFHKNLELSKALTQMRKRGQRLAIVLDDESVSQKELGIVSLQDILSAIFGKIKL